MEQKPYVTCSVGSCKQFRLQRLSEQRQRWRRMGCFRQAVPDCSRSSRESSDADGGPTGPRNEDEERSR